LDKAQRDSLTRYPLTAQSSRRGGCFPNGPAEGLVLFNIALLYSAARFHPGRALSGV